MNAVVDSSALVELCAFETQLGPHFKGRLSGTIPYVPDIADAEFHHALRGLFIGGKISAERATHARRLHDDIPRIRFATHRLMDRVWSLRDNLGVYDACFIVLAEAMDLPLLTCDAKQVTATGHRARVEMLDARK